MTIPVPYKLRGKTWIRADQQRHTPPAEQPEEDEPADEDEEPDQGTPV